MIQNEIWSWVWLVDDLLKIWKSMGDQSHVMASRDALNRLTPLEIEEKVGKPFWLLHLHMAHP